MEIYVEVTNDENMYFRNWSNNEIISKEFKCVNTNLLPNENDYIKIKFYKLIPKNETIQVDVYVRDKVGNIVLDETNGLPKTEKQNQEIITYSWQFDEDKYVELLKKMATEENAHIKNNKELMKENEQLTTKISGLQEENISLKENISSQTDMLNSIQDVVIMLSMSEE